MSKATYIKQRLSLRQPLQAALDIIENIGNTLTLTKGVDLAAELGKVKALHPACTDFEREFPSICFSIATGVGKTRLMGACIAWLYLEKGIRNFFVLAPNLTIYQKLIEDFGNPAHPKYVFHGISEFVHNRPIVITGDNYAQQGGLFSATEVRINVFNISKFNTDKTKIKSLSEYIGQSYWEHLTSLPDLVMLMDEAHRYHGKAAWKTLNELKPMLGIELTATPIDDAGKPFRNVVYEYSLAKALEDGLYVKNPAISTRQNFQAQGHTDEEIENIKLEDAVSCHEDTRNHLEIYARDNQVPVVKPFILIVCRDTTHAKKIHDYVNSDAFFKGDYKGKVLQIDSTTRNTDEIERQFLTLEQSGNPIEIVIHVNMLKEGWDVTNLYTIVPLRAANASVLIEQTIGRGLRLPYNGQRTGVPQIDLLTIMAHENFAKVIEAAQDENSILNKLTYIEIPAEDLHAKTTVVTSVSKSTAALHKEEERIAALDDPAQKQTAQTVYDARKLLIDTFNDPEIAYQTRGLKDYGNATIQQKVTEKALQTLNSGQQHLFSQQIEQEMGRVYQATLVEFRKNVIEIPRMDLVQEETNVWVEDFDLDTTAGFAFRALDEEIIRLSLTDNYRDSVGVRQGAFVRDTPANQIISELMNHPEVSYDDNADLLHKLAMQAVNALENTLEDAAQLPLVIRQYRKVIAGRIYDQFKRHLQLRESDYAEPRVLPFTRIEDWNFTILKERGYKDYRETVSPVRDIPKLVYRGFEKACHLEYKFDSNTEKMFAMILEQDANVLKWLRPAQRQFRIYWNNNSRQYHPDFIVETAGAIYMVETKAGREMDAAEVMQKARAGIRYCENATRFNRLHGGKPWQYILVPHDRVHQNDSFGYLAEQFAVQNPLGSQAAPM